MNDLKGMTVRSSCETTMLQAGNVAAFLIAMILNGLASSIAPKSLTQISSETDVRIQPAGYAFSIWGLIYTLLAIFVVY